MLLLSMGVTAADDGNDAMIFKAMNDELSRNMSDLKYKDFETPFYIAYAVHHLHNNSIQACLGTLIESSSNNNVYCGSRLMVGSYQLNDEKFNDKVNRVWYNDGAFTNFEAPDYYGIRRNLWLQTNNVYKAAAEKYKNKQDLMKKEGLSIDELKSPDFSKEEPVEYIEAALENEKPKEFLEAWAKELSLVFEKHTEVIESDVVLKYANQTSYIVDTEGRKVQLPTRLYSLTIKAKILSDKNKPMTQFLRYYGDSFADLPAKVNIKEDIIALIANLDALNKAPEYRGKYTGPLLIQDEAVFYKSFISLVRRGSGLMTNPRALVNDKNKGLGVATYFTWEDMKGKRVVDKKLSITAYPHLEIYDGESVLGRAMCDMEGVKTPEKIALVEQGKLITQLNNRTPTPSQQKSNGHCLPYFKGNSFSQQVITSVVQFDTEESLSNDSLMIELKALAEEEGLDHAMLIKPLATHADEAPMNTYQVNVNSGELSLVAGTSYSPKVSEIKKIEALSEHSIMTNTLVANQASLDNRRKQMARYPDWLKDIIRMQMGDEGAPSSFIYPDGLLLKSTTITGTNDSFRSKPRVVPSPLAQK